MVNRHAIRHCAAQLPDRHGRHDQDLAGRRLCPYRANGFDGKVLRWWGIANANGNSYSHAYGHTNAHAYANGCCNRYSYSNSDSYSDRNAHADGNINPMYGEVFTDTEASANSSA